jgi:hypothetical protein
VLYWPRRQDRPNWPNRTVLYWPNRPRR